MIAIKGKDRIRRMLWRSKNHYCPANFVRPPGHSRPNMLELHKQCPYQNRVEGRKMKRIRQGEKTFNLCLEY